MPSLQKIALAALLPLSAAAITVAAIALSADCAHANACGSCYVTGKKGHNVQRGKYNDCDVCFVVPSSQTVGFDDFDPGSVGGASRTTGQGTRAV